MPESVQQHSRVPSDYDDTVFAKIVDDLYHHVNAVNNAQSDFESFARPLLLPRETAVDDTPITVLFRAEFYQIDVSGTLYAEARIIPVQGEAAVDQIRARHSLLGNIEEGDAWTTLDNTDWITDSTYPREGYYRYRVELEVVVKGNDLVAVQVQARNSASGDMWLNQTHTFDINRSADLYTFKASVGNFNYATEKWRIYVTWEADEDTGSIGIGYGTVPYDVDDDNVTDADTGDVHDDNRSGSGSFLFEADPATAYYFVARAYTGAGGGGDSGVRVHRDSIFTPPNLASGDYLNDGSLTANMLVDTQIRASVNISMQNDATSLEDTVKYNGSIEYADGTTYTLSPADQTIDMSSSSDLWYFYFDPASDANSLQATTTAATAKNITGRRILVGVGKKATAPERAFFVVTSDEPVITAPVVNVVKLSAITADVGELSTGVIKNADYDTNGGVYLDLTTEGLSLTTPTSAPGGTDPQVILWKDGSTEVMKLFAWISGGNPLSVVSHPEATGQLILFSGNDLLLDVAGEVNVATTAIFQDELTIDVENSGGVITINDASTDPAAGNKLYAKGGNLYWDGTQLN